MSWATRAAVTAIVAYQRTLSPFVGRHCRFAPTCSEYARLALAAHGPVRGSWFAMRRVLKCHPFHPGGFDPPPPGPYAR